MTKPDVQEIRQKLYERLVPSGWAGVLKSFILSSDMDRILNRLIQESDDGKKWTPKLRQIFRAFEECPYDKLKAVMLLQDPYPYLAESGTTVADGIPMSCSNTGKIEASLKYVHGEIKRTIYPEGGYREPVDLKVWSNQGLLSINMALTTTIGKSGVHYLMWRPFVVYVLDHLSWNNGGLVYMYLGRKAQEYMKLTNDNCYKLTATHPASAGYAHQEDWDGNGIFKRCNEILKKDNKTEIIW